MASPDDPHLQTRRKRALLVAGAIGLAAIAWNADDWFDDDIVSIEVGDSDEARDVARQVRDEVRGQRDDGGEARADADREISSDEIPRITESDGVLRVETPDGRAVTITTGDAPRRATIEDRTDAPGED